jgi:urease accessory protein
MMKMNFSLPTLMAIALTSLAGTAAAHSGDHAVHGFVSGLTHPWFGLDHLLAMLAVGLWAAQQGGRALWAVPMSFVLAMVLGGVLASAGMALPYVETGIAVSVLMLGLLLVWQQRLPLALGVSLVAVFALFHGFAHGLEMPLAATPLLYGLGFVLATSLLHAIGVFAGLRLQTHLRIAGAVIAVSGAAILLGS